MGDTTLSCRTCTTPIERLQGDRGKLVGICPRCADRTQARCGVCRQPLSVRAGLGVCECGRRWSFSSGLLEPMPAHDVHTDAGNATNEPTTTLPVATPPSATPVSTELGAPLQIREERIARTDAGGYREARTTLVLTIDRPRRGPPPVPRLSWTAGAVVGGAIGILVTATLILSGDIVAAIATAAGSLLLVGLLRVLWPWYEATAKTLVAVDSRERPARRIRIDEESVCKLDGDGWVVLAPTASLARVGVTYPAYEERDRRRGLPPPRAQVIAERSGGELLLVDELEEHEAVELVRRVRAFLASMRGH